MTANDEPNNRGRGRPRDPARGEAIREATTELLAEMGYQGLTMVDVAERAGVAKTTIYRRWPTKAEMVLDVIAEDLAPYTDEETDDPLADLRRLIMQFYRQVAGEADGQLDVAPADLLGEAEVIEAFNDRFVRPMRKRAEGFARRAIEQGMLRDGVEPAELVAALAAPAIYQPLAADARPDSHLAERIFDLVIDGARAR